MCALIRCLMIQRLSSQCGVILDVKKVTGSLGWQYNHAGLAPHDCCAAALSHLERDLLLGSGAGHRFGSR